MIWRLTPLYEQDVNRVVESYDELAKENDDLRAHPQDNLHLTARASEVESLQKDKEIVLVTLHKAEEEVVVLFEENRFLNEENKTLLLLLGKRKASLRDNSPTGGATDFSYASSSRESLCHRNLQCCTSETDLNLKESCYGSTGVVVPSGNV
ncbi:uncharacterized protein LOC109728952 isoform X4 [Ananas comosus]|uniref:Uncharacterized protein LOC109728952 isoform X4 n=1 Tax=Ananas comosus TaxID=4615 RepID=A0A6P5HRZ3_ANACO|nr:uncharacterized protein LOC109728952 isoform X4 [Ananas comosus]